MFNSFSTNDSGSLAFVSNIGSEGYQPLIGVPSGYCGWAVAGSDLANDLRLIVSGSIKSSVRLENGKGLLLPGVLARASPGAWYKRGNEGIRPIPENTCPQAGTESAGHQNSPRTRLRSRKYMKELRARKDGPSPDQA